MLLYTEALSMESEDDVVLKTLVVEAVPVLLEEIPLAPLCTIELVVEVDEVDEINIDGVDAKLNDDDDDDDDDDDEVKELPAGWDAVEAPRELLTLEGWDSVEDVVMIEAIPWDAVNEPVVLVTLDGEALLTSSAESVSEAYVMLATPECR